MLLFQNDVLLKVAEIIGGVLCVPDPEHLAIADAYDGKLPHVLFHPGNPEDPNSPLVPDTQNEVRPNHIKTIIDQGRNLMAAAPPTFEVEDEDAVSEASRTPIVAPDPKNDPQSVSAEPDPATGLPKPAPATPPKPKTTPKPKNPFEQCLVKTWGRDMGAIVLEGETISAATGQLIYKLVPKGDDNLRVVPINTRFYAKIVAYDDLRHTIGQIVCYPISNDGRYFMEIHVERDGYWEIRRYNYTLFDWDEPIVPVDPNEWVHPYSQIIDAPNLVRPGYALGYPDVVDLALWAKGAFVASSMNLIARYHMSPKTIIAGPISSDGETLDAASDGLWMIQTPDGKSVQITNLQLQGDLAAGRELANVIFDWLYDGAGSVDLRRRVDTAGINAPSGISVKLMFMTPQLKKAAKSVTHEACYNEVNRRILDYKGLADYDDDTIIFSTAFGDPMPSSIQEITQSIAILLTQGLVSKETASKILSTLYPVGWNWDEEVDRMDAETPPPPTQLTPFMNQTMMGDKTPVVKTLPAEGDTVAGTATNSGK